MRKGHLWRPGQGSLGLWLGNRHRFGMDRNTG